MVALPSTTPDAIRALPTADTEFISEVVTITPSTAREWLRDYPYTGQRPLRLAHVDFLAGEMARGTFAATAIVLAETTDGRRFLIDGQHRLHALLKYLQPLRFPVTVHLARDTTQVAALYARHDQGRTRTMRERLAAYGADEETGLARKYLQAFVGAGLAVMSGFQTSASVRNVALGKSTDARLAFVRDFAPEARQYATLLSGATNTMRQWMLSSPVMSVALVTLRYRPEAAREFWRRVATNDALKKGTGEHTLHDFIRENRVAERGAGFYARATAFGWSAHYANKPTKMLRVIDDLAVITIGGTPYDGKSIIIPSYARPFIPFSEEE